jgi:hypothetical protein
MLRTEQREDAQYAPLDVEVQGLLSEEEWEELAKRIAEGIVLSRYYQVKMGAVKLEVNSVGGATSSISLPTSIAMQCSLGETTKASPDCHGWGTVHMRVAVSWW